jgi:hypothetical protein
MKRKRLLAGKGVKKNGVYVRKDGASSFESLPPGPDPNSVAKNVHDYIPKLTKKGTLFYASQNTINQRYNELQACLEGFFREDAPILVQELKENRKVTDFFGYWRRDFDLALKQQKDKSPEKLARHSISSSVFSTYFTASNPNLLTTEATLVNPPNDKSKDNYLSSHKPPRSSKSSGSVSSKLSAKSTSHSSSDEDSRRGSSPTSSLSVHSPYIVPHDAPIMFGHNPMESLPEDEELVESVSGIRITRGKSISPNGGDFNNTANTPRGRSENVDKSLNRLSWQTTTSVATSINPAAYLTDLDTDLTLPKSPTTASNFPRGSVTSLVTFMTEDSADAVIPLSSHKHRRSLSADSSRTTTLSYAESASSDQDDDLLDTYFNGMLLCTCP